MSSQAPGIHAPDEDERTYDAEYLALTQIQGDAFVTLDKKLARRVQGIVPAATIEALQAA